MHEDSVARLLISIIVPVFNAENYLERCICSLLNQEYTNTEIILVNDGSIDKSLEICQSYVEQYPKKIRLINQQNQGASIARKNGINIAKGEYLMFADSDDFVSPKYVSALYEILIKSNVEIALCPVKRVEVGEDPDFEEVITSRIMQQNELFRRFFKYEFWGYVGGIYQRGLFKNIDFPIATVNEDYYVKAQMFTHQSKVGFVEESLYCYEQHPGSLSKQPLSLRALGEFDNARATWEFFIKNFPYYSNQALAIVSEAAIKWLCTLNKQQELSASFSLYARDIKGFIKQHLKNIMLNPYLLWKIKIVIIRAFLMYRK